MGFLDKLREWLRPKPPVPPVPTPTPQPKPIPMTNEQFRSRVLTLVNDQRIQRGLKGLVYNAALASAAQNYAEVMYRTGVLTHGNVAVRLAAVGYTWSSYGENIAQGQRTPEEVVASWMNSPGHRDNILNPKFRDSGVGYAAGFWCHDFGTPKATQ